MGCKDCESQKLGRVEPKPTDLDAEIQQTAVGGTVARAQKLLFDGSDNPPRTTKALIDALCDALVEARTECTELEAEVQECADELQKVEEEIANRIVLEDDDDNQVPAAIDSDEGDF